MKLPAVRHILANSSKEEIDQAIAVLEAYSAFDKVSDEEMDFIGEMITNLCGASEIHAMIANGMTEREAITQFSRKVRGSFDQG